MRTPHMPPMSVPEKKQKYSLPLCAQRDMHMGSLDKQLQHTHTPLSQSCSCHKAQMWERQTIAMHLFRL